MRYVNIEDDVVLPDISRFSTDTEAQGLCPSSRARVAITAKAEIRIVACLSTSIALSHPIIIIMVVLSCATTADNTDDYRD